MANACARVKQSISHSAEILMRNNLCVGVCVHPRVNNECGFFPPPIPPPYLPAPTKSVRNIKILIQMKPAQYLYINNKAPAPRRRSLACSSGLFRVSSSVCSPHCKKWTDVMSFGHQRDTEQCCFMFSTCVASGCCGGSRLHSWFSPACKPFTRSQT